MLGELLRMGMEPGKSCRNQQTSSGDFQLLNASGIDSIKAANQTFTLQASTKSIRESIDLILHE